MRIVVQGGAGTIREESRKKVALEGVLQAAEEGFELLVSGKSSVNAVVEAVRIMEDLPQFNAGYGSVLTENKTIEMDALVVDGRTINMGGVIAVSSVKNPILLSKLILQNSQHILFAGQGAEKFARLNGMVLIDPKSLITDRVRDRFRRYMEKKSTDKVDPEGRDKYGTVGAVAVDEKGHLAAATSTGGILGKEEGRIGDTPIFGAGTFADKEVAISGTGVGEYIIRGLLAIRIRNLMHQYSVNKATKITLEDIKNEFGPAGVICLDRKGNWTAQKTTKDLIYAMRDNEIIDHFLIKK